MVTMQSILVSHNFISMFGIIQTGSNLLRWKRKRAHHTATSVCLLGKGSQSWAIDKKGCVFWYLLAPDSFCTAARVFGHGCTHFNGGKESSLIQTLAAVCYPIQTNSSKLVQKKELNRERKKKSCTIDGSTCLSC